MRRAARANETITPTVWRLRRTDQLLSEATDAVHAVLEWAAPPAAPAPDLAPPRAGSLNESGRRGEPSGGRTHRCPVTDGMIHRTLGDRMGAHPTAASILVILAIAALCVGGRVLGSPSPTSGARRQSRTAPAPQGSALGPTSNTFRSSASRPEGHPRDGAGPRRPPRGLGLSGLGFIFGGVPLVLGLHRLVRGRLLP